jgi:hypothetical protein
MPDLRRMSRDFSLPAVQRWSSFSRHLLRDAKGQIGKPLVGKATKPNGWPKVENPDYGLFKEKPGERQAIRPHQPFGNVIDLHRGKREGASMH